MEGLIDEEEDLIFETKPKLFSIGTIFFLKERISLLHVGVLKIKSTKESDPNQMTLDQTIIEMVPPIMKSKDFCVKLEVSLEDKVYLKTYNHHS
jgi:hypothetical protein